MSKYPQLDEYIKREKAKGKTYDQLKVEMKSAGYNDKDIEDKEEFYDIEWKTYNNKEHDFSVKYPSDWTINDQSYITEEDRHRGLQIYSPTIYTVPGYEDVGAKYSIMIKFTGNEIKVNQNSFVKAREEGDQAMEEIDLDYDTLSKYDEYLISDEIILSSSDDISESNLISVRVNDGYSLEDIFKDYSFSFDLDNIRVSEITKSISPESYDLSKIIYNDSITLSFVKDNRLVYLRASREIPDICDRSPGPKEQGYSVSNIKGHDYDIYVSQDDTGYYDATYSRFENDVCYSIGVKNTDDNNYNYVIIDLLDKEYISFGLEKDIYDNEEVVIEKNNIETCDTSTCFSEKIETCESATFNRKDSYDFIGGSNITSDVSYELYSDSNKCYLKIFINDLSAVPSQDFMESMSDANIQVLDEKGNPTTIEETYKKSNEDAQKIIDKSATCNISSSKEDLVSFFSLEKGSFTYGDYSLLLSLSDLDCSGELYEVSKNWNL